MYINQLGFEKRFGKVFLSLGLFIYQNVDNLILSSFRNWIWDFRSMKSWETGGLILPTIFLYMYSKQTYSQYNHAEAKDLFYFKRWKLQWLVLVTYYIILICFSFRSEKEKGHKKTMWRLVFLWRLFRFNCTGRKTYLLRVQQTIHTPLKPAPSSIFPIMRSIFSPV